MIRTYQRAANDHDLGAMGRGRGSFLGNILLTSLPLSAILFGIVYLIWHSVWIAAGMSTCLFVASLVSNILFFRRKKQRARQETDAKAVETLEVSASRVLDIGFVGDQGPAYCFFVGEGRALLLVGQWLLEFPSFPSASFQLHCWFDTKKPIRIELMGPQVEPEHADARLKPEHRFKAFELFNATPETLQQDLDRAFGKVQA